LFALFSLGTGRRHSGAGPSAEIGCGISSYASAIVCSYERRVNVCFSERTIPHFFLKVVTMTKSQTQSTNFEFDSRPVNGSKDLYENFATYEGHEIAAQDGATNQWRCTNKANYSAIHLYDNEYDNGDRKYKEAIREKIVELVSREHSDSFGKVETEAPINRGVPGCAALADQCEIHLGNEEFEDQILSLGRCMLKADRGLREYGVRMNMTRNRQGKQVAYLNLYVRQANAFSKGPGRWGFANLQGDSNTFGYMSASGMWSWSDSVNTWIDTVSADDDGCPRTLEQIRTMCGERHVIFHVLNMFGG